MIPTSWRGRPSGLAQRGGSAGGVRSKHVLPFIDDPDAPTAARIRRRHVQHFHDDARFHETRAFVEVAFALTASARDALGNEAGLRPSFLGHLLTEVLLDWVLIEEAPAALDAYYRLWNGRMSPGSRRSSTGCPLDPRNVWRP